MRSGAKQSVMAVSGLFGAGFFMVAVALTGTLPLPCKCEYSACTTPTAACAYAQTCSCCSVAGGAFTCVCCTPTFDCTNVPGNTICKDAP